MGGLAGREEHVYTVASRGRSHALGERVLLGAGQVLSGKDQEAEVDPAVVDLVPFGR